MLEHRVAVAILYCCCDTSAAVLYTGSVVRQMFRKRERKVVKLAMTL